MRKELRKALKEAFAKAMAVELPAFQEAQLKSRYLNPGEQVYEWKASDSARLFVIVVPHPKGGDQFTVEIGWSALGRFPELSMRPSMQPPRRGEEYQEAEYVCRLGPISKGGDYWWTLGKAPGQTVRETLAMLQAQIAPLPAAEAKAMVHAPVLDAVSDLERHGLPYLEHWVKRSG